MSSRKTIEQFVAEAKASHGDVYDYTSVMYHNANTKVEILCYKHGPFFQRPNDHVRGSGCPKCGSVQSVQTRSITTNEFIRRAKLVHGDKYDYSCSHYQSSHKKIKIICLQHGTFKQSPNTHLNGAGCPKCGTIRGAAHTTLTPDEFIRRAILIHGDRYDYSSTEYISAHMKIKILCPKHGVFKQIASKHLQGHGCRACCRRNHSNKALQWLKRLSEKENVHIQHAENGGEYRIPNTRFFVDGFCKATNTVYEFHGDVYHGNPRFDPSVRCHPFDKTQTAEQLYKQTKERERIIRELGYNLVVCWENDPKNIKRYCKSK